MLTDDQAARAMGILKRMAAQSHCCSEDREDVVQEALLRLVERGPPVLDAGLEFMCSWAINAPAWRSWRRLSVERRLRAERVDAQSTTDGRSVEKSDASSDLGFMLEAASLSERERRIVDGVLSGETHRVIAESLGVSRPVVTRRLHRVYARISALTRSD